jgi:diguanylate cyclase (GGDEF)-like protein
MGWEFLPQDAKQRLRLKRYFMAALSYAIWISISFYCYALGYIDISVPAMAWWVGMALLGNVVFYVVFRTGLNRYWPDPSLTLPQMLVATFWVMLLMTLAPQVRGILLLLYVVVFLFGVFRLGRRDYLLLTALVLVAYGFVVLHDVYRSKPPLPLSLELLQFVVLGATLVWLAFFGSYVGRLRATVSRRNSELAAALRQNRELAIHDDLTGTYNRRHIIHILAEEQRRARRTGRSFCICLMDLDHFKEINDRNGHLVGDEMLKQFADRVTGEIRTLDRVGRDGASKSQDASTFGRYGGEEFLLVLPETDMEGALICAERIRKRVADTEFKTGGGGLRMTVSCGVTAYHSDEDMRGMLARADQALYLAKQRGRDRVEAAKG